MGSAAANGYQRNFLIFSNEDNGFEEGKKPSGYLKLEMREGKGRLDTVLHNLRDGKGRFVYALYLLRTSADAVDYIRVGEVRRLSGRNVLEWTFDPGRTGYNCFAIGEFEIAAILVEYENRTGSGIICPMAAYRNRRTGWRNGLYKALQMGGLSARKTEGSAPEKTVETGPAVYPEPNENQQTEADAIAEARYHQQVQENPEQQQIYPVQQLVQEDPEQQQIYPVQQQLQENPEQQQIYPVQQQLQENPEQQQIYPVQQQVQEDPIQQQIHPVQQQVQEDPIQQQKQEHSVTEAQTPADPQPESETPANAETGSIIDPQPELQSIKENEVPALSSDRQAASDHMTDDKEQATSGKMADDEEQAASDHMTDDEEQATSGKMADDGEQAASDRKVHQAADININYPDNLAGINTGCVYLNGNLCDAFIAGRSNRDPCSACRINRSGTPAESRPSGDLEQLRKELDESFEASDPFRSKRSDYKWWRVTNPVNLNNILYQNNIRSPLLFNPAVMMAHYKYRHLIIGIFTHKNGRKYVVCGVPGMHMVDMKPFGEMNTWVQAEGSRLRYGAFGYWLVYIDPDNGRIMNPK